MTSAMASSKLPSRGQRTAHQPAWPVAGGPLGLVRLADGLARAIERGEHWRDLGLREAVVEPRECEGLERRSSPGANEPARFPKGPALFTFGSEARPSEP